MDIHSYKGYLASNGCSIGQLRKKQSDMLMNASFDKDATYKRGMLYNANLEPIEMVEFKFQKAQTYTINKDQVEYFVQFRPGYHPEKKQNIEDKIYRLYDDGKERLSFYLDITDDDGDIYKWLIVGRNNDNAFVRYNVLQCNWTFEWMVDRKYYSCLGVMRSRNNYNSGVWSDGYTTTVENQTAFFIPTNNNTRTIDYDRRFMITDNPIHPKTYEVSKVEDTFPLGVLKVTLVQDHYNEHTDICGLLLDDGAPAILNDGKVHMICDYKTSALTPIDENMMEVSKWHLSKVHNKLYIGSKKAQVITALNDDGVTDFDNSWTISLDGVALEPALIDEYFDIAKTDNALSIRVKSSMRKLLGSVVRVSIGNEAVGYYDYVEMEVAIN